MAKWIMQKGIVPLLNPRKDWIMKTLFAIAALAVAGFASNAANADTVHRHHRASAQMRTAPQASFQSLYQGGSVSNDCDGQRVYGFCPVR
jgi:hypothetical protein